MPEGGSPIRTPEHRQPVITGKFKKEEKSLSSSEDVNIKAACWRDRAAVQSSHLILRLSDPFPAVIYYEQARRRVSGWIPSVPPPLPHWDSSAVFLRDRREEWQRNWLLHPWGPAAPSPSPAQPPAPPSPPRHHHEHQHLHLHQHQHHQHNHHHHQAITATTSIISI